MARKLDCAGGGRVVYFGLVSLGKNSSKWKSQTALAQATLFQSCQKYTPRPPPQVPLELPEGLEFWNGFSRAIPFYTAPFR